MAPCAEISVPPEKDPGVAVEGEDNGVAADGVMEEQPEMDNIRREATVLKKMFGLYMQISFSVQVRKARFPQETIAIPNARTKASTTKRNSFIKTPLLFEAYKKLVCVTVALPDRSGVVDAGPMQDDFLYQKDPD